MPDDSLEETPETTNELLRDVADVLRSIEAKLADLILAIEKRS